MTYQLLLDATTAGSLLGVSAGRIYQMVKAGELPAVRTGRAVRIPAESIESRLKGTMPTPADETS